MLRYGDVLVDVLVRVVVGGLHGTGRGCCGRGLVGLGFGCLKELLGSRVAEGGRLSIG